jgi:hypothetical protein
MILKKKTQSELMDIYNTNDHKISSDYIGFFENIWKTKATEVLTCSLRKIVGNLKKNVKPEEIEKHNLDCYNITTLHNFKKLTF